ncbi:MAG: type 1 glutamine amidotransferase domain-containing protein [Solirubrobacteraceae bacterium]
MSLAGTRVALLIEDDYQELEAWYPKLRLEEAGAEVTVVGSGRKDSFESKLGYPMEADATAAEVNADDFDAVIVPGGFAPDHMRLCSPMVELVRDIYESGKLTAAICHGGWMLCSAGAVRGRRATGYEPIRTDVENAGGEWVDEAVVVDGNLITSRTPPDIPAFLAAIVSYLETGHVESAVVAAATAGGAPVEDEYR